MRPIKVDQREMALDFVSEEHRVMLQKLSAFPLLACIALVAPLHAVAQETKPPVGPQPEWYWGPGPWHMWGGYGWYFWLMGPLMMLFMFLICAALR